MATMGMKGQQNRRKEELRILRLSSSSKLQEEKDVLGKGDLEGTGQTTDTNQGRQRGSTLGFLKSEESGGKRKSW